jgi:hypothetical protein
MQRVVSDAIDVFQNAISETPKVQIEGSRRLFWTKTKLKKKKRI